MSLPRAKKALGQNFLVDRGVVTRIGAALGLRGSEPVLEVGPGRGALTALLAEQAGQVLAVELDRELLPVLAERFPAGSRVEVVHGDILAVDLPALLAARHPAPWRVAANLPYNISTPVLFRFLELRGWFDRLVVMLQKEVADRLAAPPGGKDYGILSVLFQQHFQVRREFLVRPGAFHPVPKVDSAVISLATLPAPREQVADEAAFTRLVKAAFNQRRKTLWNALRGGGIADDELLRAAFTAAGIDPVRRAETLSLAEFARLATAVAQLR